VEIRQHVETTPTVYKNFVVGTILVNKWDLDSMLANRGKTGSFTVIGMHRVFCFVGDDYISIRNTSDYTASASERVVDDAKLISYLRERAQKSLGDVIQEIEEGVFDD